MAAIFALFAYRTIEVSTGERARDARFRVITRTPFYLHRLRKDIDTLRATIDNIDSLSFAELRSRLNSLSTTLSNAIPELEAQQHTLEELNLAMSGQADKYQSLQTDVQRLTAFRQEQLAQAAEILNRASHPSQDRSFYLGILLSFPIGVAASFLASYAWDVANRLRTKRNTNEPGNA